MPAGQLKMITVCPIPLYSTKRKFKYFSGTKAYLKKGPSSNPRFFTEEFVETIIG